MDISHARCTFNSAEKPSNNSLLFLLRNDLVLASVMATVSSLEDRCSRFSKIHFRSFHLQNEQQIPAFNTDVLARNNDNSIVIRRKSLCYTAHSSGSVLNRWYTGLAFDCRSCLLRGHNSFFEINCNDYFLNRRFSMQGFSQDIVCHDEDFFFFCFVDLPNAAYCGKYIWKWGIHSMYVECWSV